MWYTLLLWCHAYYSKWPPCMQMYKQKYLFTSSADQLLSARWGRLLDDTMNTQCEHVTHRHNHSRNRCSNSHTLHHYFIHHNSQTLFTTFESYPYSNYAQSVAENVKTRFKYSSKNNTNCCQCCFREKHLKWSTHQKYNTITQNTQQMYLIIKFQIMFNIWYGIKCTKSKVH